MSDLVANPRAFQQGLNRSLYRFNKNFGNSIRRLVTEAHIRLMEKTPVHTGQAVMNYIATQGRPYSGPILEAGDPVEATNKLPLGSERLRGPATSRADASLDQLTFDDPYQDYWITNRAPHISGLENGDFPEGRQYTPRSPAGMFGVTLQELRMLLRSGYF